MDSESIKKEMIRLVAISLIAIIILIMALFSGCAPVRVYTEPKGTVMIVEGHAVKVGFPIIHKNEIIGVSTNWFYFRDGHNYNIGDHYPEISKVHNCDW